jgi:hypothetical protein
MYLDNIIWYIKSKMNLENNFFLYIEPEEVIYFAIFQKEKVGSCSLKLTIQHQWY